MTPKAERVNANDSYHRRDCLCCVQGDPIPYMPGEKRWKRYILPGIVGAAFIIGVATSLYYHRMEKNQQSQPQKELSDKVQSIK